jgi:uncharacterized protein (DUF1778 family)
MVMANPNGRPRKPPAEVLAERLEIRLTTAEKLGFAEAAQVSGLSLSEWLRARLKTASQRDLRKK